MQVNCTNIKFWSNFAVTSNFTKLKLSDRIESNLQKNSLRKCPAKIDTGVKIQSYPATIGLPRRVFFFTNFPSYVKMWNWK